MTAKVMPMPKPEKVGKQMDETKNPDEWQVKHWAETVMDGEKIKADPKKMRHVKKHLKMSHKVMGAVIKSTDDLRQKAKEMAESTPDSESGEPAGEV